MDFNPPKKKLKIGKKSYQLDNLTLLKLSEIKDEVGELYEVFDKMRKTPLIIVKVFWILIIDKDQFEDDFKKFENAFLGTGSTPEHTKEAMDVLYAVIKNSMPLVINEKRRKDIDKIIGDTKETVNCYVDFYDSIASRYGYTIEDFYNLTLRQIMMLLKKVSNKRHDELAIKAALMGRKIEDRVRLEEIPEEQEKEQEDQARAALKRLQQEYALNKVKGIKDGQ